MHFQGTNTALSAVGGVCGVTLPNPVPCTGGPVRQLYCKSNQNFPLDVKDCLIVPQVLLLCSEVDKVDIYVSGKTAPFPQWRCYLYLLNTKATNNNSMQTGNNYKQRGTHGSEIMNREVLISTLKIVLTLCALKFLAETISDIATIPATDQTGRNKQELVVAS